MQKIASFQINHDTLEKGMYISRKDGDVITYDIRMRKPNAGDYLDMNVAHTLEHLLATYLRNSPIAGNVIYVGPMGCRTGFYILFRDAVSYAQAIESVKNAMAFARDFTGEIPGSRKEECGNYLAHDLFGAKKEAKAMCEILEQWKEKDLEYKV